MQERMKLFSVTMTEEELRLFSEFLAQKEFRYYGPLHPEYWADRFHEEVNDGWNRFDKKARSRSNDAYNLNKDILRAYDYRARRADDDEIRDCEAAGQDYAHRRYELTTGYRDLEYDQDKKNWVYTNHSGETEEMSPEDRATINTWEKEFRNRISQNNAKFENKSKLRKDIHDATLLYEANTGRSFGKDAAIAAGVTAGLVGGGIALRKHLKKKKADKKKAEKKFKK